jgi:hypothetical protein
MRGQLGRCLVFFAALSSSTAVGAQSLAAGDVISIYRDLNEMCRGGAGDASSTDKACEVREKVSKLLKQMDYCFGKKGESGGEMWWHRCTANSLR